MTYGARPINFTDIFASVNWNATVLGTTNRTDLTRPYTSYAATCQGVQFTYPKDFPPLSPTADRACILTDTPGKIFRGGLDKFNPDQPQLGLVHKMAGGGLVVRNVESLPAWADTIVLVQLGIETLGSDLQTNTKATGLDLARNNIQTIASTNFPTLLSTLTLSHNAITALTSISAPNLKYLDLSFNNISSLKTAVFPDTLRQLYLFNNPNMSMHKMTLPPILQTLHAHNCGIPFIGTVKWSPLLDDLILANNRIKSIGNTTFPPSLTSLNLANNNITQLRANFPPTLQYLYLGGNPITAFYANASQFAILDQLQNPRKTNVSCDVAETYPGDCGIVFSSTQINATCQNHTGIQMLWDTFPICIIADDPIVREDHDDGDWDHNGNHSWWRHTHSPSDIAGSATATTDRPFFPFFLIGVVFLGVFIALGFYYIRRHIKKRNEAKWYNEITTKDKVLDATDQCEVINDIRHDPAFAVFRIPANHIERGSLLARGGYGLVYLATLRNAGKPSQFVAMKQMLPEKTSDMAAVEEFMEEIRVSARLYHPKIVRFIGLSWTNIANLSMICEYMERGDLWTLLEMNKTQRRIDWNVNPHFRVDFARQDWLSNTSPSSVSTSTAKSRHFVGLQDAGCRFSKFSVLFDIAQALQYLHAAEINIIHRDVKAKNVLLTDAGDAKLTDFGTSRETTNDQTMTAEIGTVPWIAPEILMGVRYSAKADIYSFGVLMSEIDLCIVPYSDLKMVVPAAGVSVAMAKARISMMVVSGELRPSFSKACPQAMIEIAQRCLAFNPLDRPCADELVAWLQQFIE
ncbi:unnamed protein product [Aphanomyces euteiches]|uniref:Protein kinase domain-containing protein n=1 Tax=Aphanomyces euteiches TaxID=100861 RepID=A0A6G0WT19_9STRA|nr:hypothetical protein Ae201684_012032 [Aphanomyces euteiches]KAH9155408.1 hypothetical protein AeRB84_002609 [Aphanomyces euteiches]